MLSLYQIQRLLQIFLSNFYCNHRQVIHNFLNLAQKEDINSIEEEIIISIHDLVESMINSESNIQLFFE